MLLAACMQEAPADDPGEPLETPESWGPEHCTSPEGVVPGWSIGEQLSLLILKDCAGNDVPMDAICGADATWMFFAHAWCPHCQKAAAEAEGILDAFGDKNLAVINVVVEDNGGGPATAGLCTSWRETFEQERVLTLFDPIFKSSFLWEQNYTALNVFLDADRIIRDKIHTDRADAITQALSTVLP